MACPDEQQENLRHVFDDCAAQGLESRVSYVKQLGRKNSFNLAKRDINEFSSLLASVETSLGGLRQEVHAVKQLSSSRGGSSPQQQLTGLTPLGASAELLEPVASFPCRLSPPVRRSSLAFSDAAASRRSSLGVRWQQQGWEGSSMACAGGDDLINVEERIYAGIANALKATAASARPAAKPAAAAPVDVPTKASPVAGSPAAARQLVTPAAAGGPLQHNSLGELSSAAELQQVEAPSAAASTVAAAMQELAAAAAVEHLSLQLQEQLDHLEKDVDDLKESVAAHLRGEHSCSSSTYAASLHQDALQQLQEQQQQQSQTHERLQQRQENMQQELMQQSKALGRQLQQQQSQISALTAELQHLKAQQQQEQKQPPSAEFEQLLNDMREQFQHQLSQLGRQQEERLSVLVDDFREELLDRLDGLQLRVQAVEEEQEQLVDRQRQQRMDVENLKAATELQREQEGTAAVASSAALPRSGSTPRQPVSSTARCRVSTCENDGLTIPAQSHSDGGATCALPAALSLPDMAPMLPSCISEPEQDSPSAAHKPAGSSILDIAWPGTQQPPCVMQGLDAEAATRAAVPGQECSSAHMPGAAMALQDVSAQLRSHVAGLEARVCVLEQQQPQVESLLAQLEVLQGSVPLDGMTCAAVEARLSVLEENAQQHKQQLQDSQAQLASTSQQLQQLDPQLDAVRACQQTPQQQQQPQQPQQPQVLDAPGEDMPARIARLEAQQKELQEQQQRLEAAQQQLASGEASAFTTVDSQPSSVKERIQQFEEQLNAAIRRFAPSQFGSRPGSEGGTQSGGAGAPGELSPLISRKNPGRESSLRELLANLQADAEQLLSKAPSAAGDSDASFTSEAPAGCVGAVDEAAAAAVGATVAVQMQQQLAQLTRLTQNCAELGEAVLQLDLQVQQVEDRVKQQRQQTLTATQSATAATYISKEAAHEIERVALQVQQLTAAIDASARKGTAVVGADAATASAEAAAAADGIAEQVRLVTESLQQAKEQLEQQVEQLRHQHAEQHQEHGVRLAQLEQQQVHNEAMQDQLQSLQVALQDMAGEKDAASAHLDEEREKVADLQAALEKINTQLKQLSIDQQSAAAVSQDFNKSVQQELIGLHADCGSLQDYSKEAQKQFEQHGAVSQQQLLQLNNLRAELEEQQTSHAGLQQRVQQNEALLQQLQLQSEQVPQLTQQVEQHTEQLAAVASHDALEMQRQKLADVQQALQQLQAAQQLQQQEQQAAAGTVMSAAQEQLQKATDKLQQQEQTLDEQSGLLFSLRVDLQNGLEELGKRVSAAEGVRENLDIWEASRKAAAARTEAAAAEALDKVEAMMASLADQQAQLAAAATSAGGDLRAEMERMQQQLEPLLQDVSRLQQQLTDATAQSAAQLKELQAAAAQQVQAVEQQVGEQLSAVRAQVLEQTQQEAQQLRQQLEALTSDASEQRRQLVDQIDSKLQPVQEQVVKLQQQQVQQQDESAAAQQQMSQQLQGLLACTSELQQKLLQQQHAADAQHKQHAAAVEQQAELIQQVQASLSVLQDQQQDTVAQQCQQLEQQLQSLRASLTADLLALQATTQQHAEQQTELHEAVVQLTARSQQLQQQLQELPPQVAAEQVHAEVQALHQQLQQQHELLQQGLEQKTQQLQQSIQEVEQQGKQLQGQQQATKEDAARQAELLQQQHEQHLHQLQQQQAVLSSLQQAQSKQATQVQRLKEQQDRQLSELVDTKQQVHEANTKLGAIGELQEQQKLLLGDVKQQKLLLSDVKQQQDQGAQQLQQLQVQVAGLSSGVAKATADTAAAASSAAGAEEQVRELRDDLEEALGFMAPFLSPAASSLTSPGATPFVSPHRQPPRALPPEGVPACSSSQSPFAVPGATYSLNPLHGVSRGMPGYSVTIDIGAQVPIRQGPHAVVQTAMQALQQQQQLVQPSAARSPANSLSVSQKDCAGALGVPVAYMPLSAGLWRPEPHQLAAVAVADSRTPKPEPQQAAPAASAGAAASAAGGKGSTSSTPAPTAAAATGLGAESLASGSGRKLTRCASLDSPSFKAAALACVSYDPTPPSQPNSGSRPFRVQLPGAAAAGGGKEPAGLSVTPDSLMLASTTRAGGSSAGRLVRAFSLDSPSYVAAATAGVAYDATPVTSLGGAQTCEVGSASRFAVSLNAADAALRLFDALGDAADGSGAAAAAQQQELLQQPVRDESPEQHRLRRLPGGVAAAAAAALRSGGTVQRTSVSTAEGAGSVRSSAVWSARDSAVFDNSLYNTPRKRHKTRLVAACTGEASAGVDCAGGADDASDASSESGGSHTGLVSLTDSLTALQLRRLQQQQYARLEGVAAAGSPPVTPTAAGAAVDASSPATTATPVSLYRNIMFEESRDSLVDVPLQGGAFNPTRPSREQQPAMVEAAATGTAAAAAAAIIPPFAAGAQGDSGPGFATPAAAAQVSSSAEAAAAEAMLTGRRYSPAEAVATVRSLATSATPPSLGSWQKQQRLQQRQSSAAQPAAPHAQEKAQQQDTPLATPSSCDFAAGSSAANSPAMLPAEPLSEQQQQQQGSPGLPVVPSAGRRGVSPVLSALLSEVDSSDEEEVAVGSQQQQQPAVLSAEVLEQHTLQQQQQQRYGSMHLPWLQQHGQELQQDQAAQPASPEVTAAAAGGSGVAPGVSVVLDSHPGAAGDAVLPEGLMSPMLSELMSLGADVIDLEGSEADSDLLAVTPERHHSRPGVAPAPTAATALAQAAAGYTAGDDPLSRRLLFEELAGGEEGGCQQGAGVAEQGHAARQTDAASSLAPQQSEQQQCEQYAVAQQQGQVVERAASISLTGMQLAVAMAAGSVADDVVVPPSSTELAAAAAVGSPGPAADEEPVLRLKGGAGYEPPHAADMQGECSGGGWQLGVEDSFDLADYASSSDSGSDEAVEDPWELIQCPGSAAGVAYGANTAVCGTDTPVGCGNGCKPLTAAGGDRAVGGCVPVTADKAVKQADAPSKARSAAVPQGWLRSLPKGWASESAPGGGFRVALCTSGKPGSGTKARVTLLLTVQCSSGDGINVTCEHKLGGGRKRCSFSPGSTVQDWLLLQTHPQPTHVSCSPAGSGEQQQQQQGAVAEGLLQHVPPGALRISSVCVSHDAAGFSGAWLLDDVILQHIQSGEWWRFVNRGGWIKGSQQAKAVAAKLAESATAAAAAAAASAANAGSSDAGCCMGFSAARELHLSASGIAANCPLPSMPENSQASNAGQVLPCMFRSSQLQPHRDATQQQHLPGISTVPSTAYAVAPGQGGAGPVTSSTQQPAGQGSSSNSSRHGQLSCVAAVAVAVVGDLGAGASATPEDAAALATTTITTTISSCCVPLDDVELKLRGSPRKGPAGGSRSCSPSPTHKNRQRQQQQQQQQQLEPGMQAEAAASAAVPVTSGEVTSLRSLAAMVSKVAAPAAAAAWGSLASSRRSSAGDLKHPGGRRVSGSIAPAKLVPLLAGRGSSNEDGWIGAARISDSAAAAGISCRADVADAAADLHTAAGPEVASTSSLTHSADGTPCRLVRCSSSYLGRTSSSGAQQTRDQHPEDQAGRAVHFLEWAEQLEFDASALQGRRNAAGSSGTSSSSSIQSFTEEQLLEAQGGWEFVRPPEASSSYTTLINATPADTAAASSSAAVTSQCTATPAGNRAGVGPCGLSTGSGELQEVPLVVSKPVSLLNRANGAGSEYQLRLHTADKMSAALPAGQVVCVEVLGSSGALLTTQLPRPKGSFLRGCCDCFSLSSAAGDIGCIEALRLWHTPGGSSMGGSWCLHMVEVEAVFRGTTFVFGGSNADFWIGRGAERAVVLTQPKVLRSDDKAALWLQIEELQQQLHSNAGLDESDRVRLANRLQQLRADLQAGAVCC